MESSRSNLKTIWYVVLGLFAAPIGIPFVLALLLFLAVGFAFLAAFMAVMFAFFVIGGITVLKAFALLFTSNWAIGSFYLGIGLLGMGVILLLLPIIAKALNFLIAKLAVFMRSVGRKFLKKDYYQTSTSNQGKEK
ncbi:hypothetical protein EQ500_02815 [Lactobacillus sp. XV13L]|nr:hypothetical protein [Lactobacillus sp. XV13L]